MTNVHDFNEEAVHFFRQMQEECMKQYNPHDANGRRVIQYFERAIRSLKMVEDLKPLNVKVSVPYEEIFHMKDQSFLQHNIRNKMICDISNYIANIIQVTSYDEEEIRMRIFKGHILVYNPPEKGVVE